MSLERLKKAQQHLQAGEPDEAWDLVNEVLFDDPNDPRALMMACHIQDKARRLTIAYQFAERAVHRAPNISEVWLNFGRISDELYRLEDAEMAYKKAIGVARTDAQKAMAMQNLGALYITAARWEDAENTSREALKLDPNGRKAKGNLGMACLAQKKWEEGWKGYEAILGSEHRKFIQYGNEPQWDGEKGKNLVIYGEQGIGDEIVSASMFNEAINDSKKVVIDCDKRLEGLFKRSFPRAKVYGTRTAKAGDGVVWDKEDHEIDASITSFGLGKFYRKSDEDFPTKPYLSPDPERVAMWNALFDKIGRPVYGVAWSGGVQWTGSKFRKVTLDQLSVLLGSIKANWVSLQYKDAAEEIEAFRIKHPRINVRQFAYGTLTKDYDDTAAMVAAMDGVLSVPTAVVHLASGLGVPTIAMKSPYSCWKFHNGMFLPGVTLVNHRETWDQTIGDTINVLVDQCSRYSSGTTRGSRLLTTSCNTPLSGTQASQSQSRPLSLASSR